jgi:hypothetical protein
LIAIIKIKNHHAYIAFASLVLSLMSTPLHAAEQYNSRDTDIPVFAAFISDELKQRCDTNTTDCIENAISQSLYEDKLALTPLSELLSNGYELLVGSAVVSEEQSHQLVLELTVQWHGLPIHEINTSVNLAELVASTPLLQKPISLANTSTTKLVELALEKSLDEWEAVIEDANVFSASYLHELLEVSNYKDDLIVPAAVGQFELRKQHLNVDPFNGMLSRYIHTQFDLAVLDVYVYPLAANSNTSSQLINELTDEQKDIKLLSAAFGKEALQMSSVNLAEQMSDELATDVYYFEATLDTSSDEVISEPLFVTQYAFVKEDKIVRFSTNIPLRITKPLVAQMATQVQVPAMSAFMQDIRGPLLVQHSEL